MKVGVLHCLAGGALALAIGAASGSAWAQARSPVACPVLAMPTIRFELAVSPPYYVHDQTIEQMQDLSAKRGSPIDFRHRLLGVTVINPKFAISGKGQTLRHGNVSCVYFTELKAMWGWDSMSVYVAREFAEDSCAYRAVMDHENQHVAVHNQAIEDFAPLAREAMERAIRAMGPVVSTDPNRAFDLMMNDINARVQPIVREFNAFNLRRNGALDTPESYAAVSARCTDWSTSRRTPVPEANK